MGKNWKPEIQTWPVTKLTPYARNTKAHPPAQVDRIAGSIAANGFVQPILVDKEGVIIAGHGRHLAAQKLGMSEVPVIIADHLSEGEVRALRLADNRLNESPWDTDMLRFELKGLEDMGIDLKLADFSIPDISKFIEDGKIIDGLFDSPRHTGAEEEEIAPVDGEDDVPEVPEKLTWVKSGELWTLGRHRLLCGDSTKKADVERLMCGRTSLLMITDPPYGVKLDQSWRDEALGDKAMGKGNSNLVSNDDRSDWTEAWEIAPVTIAYIWHASSFTDVVMNSLRRSDFEVRQQIIWNKSVMIMGRSAYHFKHEPCWYAVKRGANANWLGDRKQTTVWDAAPPNHIMAGSTDDKTDHPTQKPLAVYEIPILNHTTTNDALYEPFGGSGTALIAAEKHNRACYAIELDPHYCSVILRRWAEYTGNDPVREDGVRLSDLMQQ